MQPSEYAQKVQEQLSLEDYSDLHSQQRHQQLVLGDCALLCSSSNAHPAVRTRKIYNISTIHKNIQKGNTRK